MDPIKVLSLRVEEFQNMLIARATGKPVEDKEYKMLREHLVSRSEISDALPRIVFTCRDPDQFWAYIKSKASTYQERREIIWGEFEKVLGLLERKQTPSSKSIHETIKRFSSDAVHLEWMKALERRTEDPAGAITMARTLLESVCKHILDDDKIEYKNGEELPNLYRMCAETLNLAPSQHTEKIFRQILGGCTAVVEGLGALRNRVSDAHGSGRIATKPSQRHAHLSVNLAGSMATFLIETWEHKKKEKKP